MESKVSFRNLFTEPTKNGLTRPKRVRGSGVYMVNMGELFAHRRIGSIEMDRVPLSPAESSFLLQPDDLLFARQSLVLSGAGQCSIFLGHDEPVTFESHLIRCRINKAKADPRFLFYLFGSSVGRQILEPIIQQGAGASGLKASDLACVELPNVPLPSQISIATCLSSLDDRIDHNRALAAKLEAIARRLFKSWFVDFDPVRALAAGEKPAGLADDLAALFPDRFVGSELGEIPEGWACNKVSELCEAIFSGGTPHTQTPGYWGGGLPWLSSGETRSRFIVETEKTITQIGVDNSSTRKARAGDVVIASAGQGATRGQTSLLALDTYINQSVVALRASKEAYSSALLFLDLSSRYDEMRSISDSHSSRGSLTTKLLGSMLSVVPPTPVVVAFDALVSPVIERIVVAERENSSLGTIRDLLLPRLVSGKLSVTDAEFLIEEAVV